MNEREYEIEAKALCEAIKKLASNDYAIENFESYMSYHFKVWFNKYVRIPNDLIYELETFANITE